MELPLATIRSVRSNSRSLDLKKQVSKLLKETYSNRTHQVKIADIKFTDLGHEIVFGNSSICLSLKHRDILHFHYCQSDIQSIDIDSASLIGCALCTSSMLDLPNDATEVC